MKIQNRLIHMRGKVVLCNGRKYQIDDMGCVDVDDEADLKRLLAAAEWQQYRKPVDRDEMVAESAKPAKPEPTPEKKAPPEAPPEEPQEADQAAEPEQEPDNEGQGGDADAADADEEDEWPDPDVSMSKAQLQKIANAYEVEYEAKTTKAELVELINAKMYD